MIEEQSEADRELSNATDAAGAGGVGGASGHER
jgi:hypothetical protein